MCCLSHFINSPLIVLVFLSIHSFRWNQFIRFFENFKIGFSYSSRFSPFFFTQVSSFFRIPLLNFPVPFLKFSIFFFSNSLTLLNLIVVYSLFSTLFLSIMFCLFLNNCVLTVFLSFLTFVIDAACCLFHASYIFLFIFLLLSVRSLFVSSLCSLNLIPPLSCIHSFSYLHCNFFFSPSFHFRFRMSSVSELVISCFQ